MWHTDRIGFSNLTNRRGFCRLLLALAAVVVPAPPGRAQPASSDQTEIGVLFRGDDMGSTHAANLACIQAYREGVLRSVEVMVPGPWFPEAVRLLGENPELDVGVHLTLTSEWDNLKWRPLTWAPTLTDENGYFPPLIFANPQRPGVRSLQGASWSPRELEGELRAQISLARRLIPRISHLSDHMVIGALGPEVASVLQRLADEFGLLLDLRPFDVKPLSWGDPHRTPEEKIESLVAVLERLTPGSYLMIDHPGLDTFEMQAIHHPGYEDVALDRAGVTAAWTSAEVKEVITRRHIRLLSYADLRHSKTVKR